MNQPTKLLAAVIAAATLASCSYANMGPGEQAVVQDGYFMIPTDPKLTGCIGPEHSQNEITNDVFRYPARQISWDATGDPGSERGPYVVVSSAKAPADMNVPVVVTFDLTTDCDKLKQFHRDFGTKYSGWLNEDGTVSPGWAELLNYVVGQPLQDTLNAVAQKYTWQQIWNDENVRTEFREALAKALPVTSKARTDNTDFFSNFQVTVLKPTPVNPDLKAAIERQQAAIQDAQATEAKGVADANAKRAKADADLQAAVAETKVAEQEALKRLAESRGYGSPEDYLKALAIQQGLNPYQPTYVVPQGGR